MIFKEYCGGVLRATSGDDEVIGLTGERLEPVRADGIVVQAHIDAWEELLDCTLGMSTGGGGERVNTHHPTSEADAGFLRRRFGVVRAESVVALRAVEVAAEQAEEFPVCLADAPVIAG